MSQLIRASFLANGQSQSIEGSQDQICKQLTDLAINGTAVHVTSVVKLPSGGLVNNGRRPMPAPMPELGINWAAKGVDDAVMEMPPRPVANRIEYGSGGHFSDEPTAPPPRFSFAGAGGSAPSGQPGGANGKTTTPMPEIKINWDSEDGL